MPKQITSTFTQYSFSEAEMEELLLLNPLLEMYLQTRLATIANEKLHCKYDPTNPVRFAQVEAELAGKISILDELLDESRALRERKQQELLGSNTNDE